jgi:hypothetical protein
VNPAPTLHILEDLSAPTYMGGVGGAVLGAALPTVYALARRRAPSLLPLTTGAVLGELGGAAAGGGYGLYRRARRKQSSVLSSPLARYFAAGAVVDTLLNPRYSGDPVGGALKTTALSAGLSGLLSEGNFGKAVAHSLPSSAALGAGVGASRLAKGLYQRAKSSGALDRSYDVSYTLPDQEVAEGTVRLPAGRVPLLRSLFSPDVESYGGVSDQEILDAALAGGADIPGSPARTLVGFETLHGYRPGALSVSKTSAARVWYRLRSA